MEDCSMGEPEHPGQAPPRDGLVMVHRPAAGGWRFEPCAARQKIRSATVYRTAAKASKPEFEQHNYGEPDEPQFQLAVFTDGRVAQRWLVPGGRSSCWWDCLADLYAVHIYAHPDYGTKVVWDDGTMEEL